MKEGNRETRAELTQRPSTIVDVRELGCCSLGFLELTPSGHYSVQSHQHFEVLVLCYCQTTAVNKVAYSLDVERAKS